MSQKIFLAGVAVTIVAINPVSATSVNSGDLAIANQSVERGTPSNLQNKIPPSRPSNDTAVGNKDRLRDSDRLRDPDRVVDSETNPDMNREREQDRVIDPQKDPDQERDRIVDIDVEQDREQDRIIDPPNDPVHDRDQDNLNEPGNGPNY
jgi:hypothetical protein